MEPIFVMTREDYLAALDAWLAEYRGQLIEKWDHGALEHGAPAILNDPRNGDALSYWFQHIHQEDLDKANYKLIIRELVRQRGEFADRMVARAAEKATAG